MLFFRTAPRTGYMLESWSTFMKQNLESDAIPHIFTSPTTHQHLPKRDYRSKSLSTMQLAAVGFIVFLALFAIFCALLIFWEQRCKKKGRAHQQAQAENRWPAPRADIEQPAEELVANTVRDSSHPPSRSAYPPSSAA